jgi:formamidopyrimidine-DNA glycosylase
MPELPEVETLCGQLKYVVLNTAIQGIEILDPKLEMIHGAVGEKITDVARRGKALEIYLGNKQKIVLHLRMTGRLLWQTDKQELPKHVRFTIDFPHGRLVFIDPRRFATLNILDQDAGGALIHDPLQECSGNRLSEIARNRKLPIKTFLMDQRMIAGIGNIYACEILHAASIDPLRKTCNLSRKEWDSVAEASQRILSRAIACRGTSISDWRDLSGLMGEYQHELKVYARHGHPCPKCHGTIQRMRLNGRGTYFCPSCQK